MHYPARMAVKIFKLGLPLFLLLVMKNPFLHAEERIPERIVSLSPVTTEELFLLKAGERVVGRTRYCTKPPEALEKEEVGNLVEVSVEKIVALRPDLVLAGPMTDPKAKEKLRQLGLRVEEFPAADDFKGICASFLRLSRMLGREKEAEAMIADAQARVNALRAPVLNASRPSVFVEVGADPLVTMTQGSFLNDLIEFAGGVNIARGTGSKLYSREEVLAQDPDFILITIMGFDGEKEKRLWQNYSHLRAVQNGRVHVVDSDLYCSPTPLSFPDALKRMIEILHPASVTQAVAAEGK
jgi:iron complex transport system substrate-binding protein